MIIFVAYEGFELIANAAPDIRNPERNIPRAYYISTIFVIVLYVVIAIITVGSLSFAKIVTAQDYVLAEAAQPMLGQLGFTVITVAALISTFSTINASLYGGSRVSYEIAQDDELPPAFTHMFWNQPVGLAITTALTLVAVNTLKLESISTAGSIGFLLIFAIVNLMGLRNAAEIHSKRWIPLFGVVLCFLALAALVTHKLGEGGWDLVIAAGTIGSCIAVDWLYKSGETRRTR